MKKVILALLMPVVMILGVSMPVMAEEDAAESSESSTSSVDLYGDICSDKTIDSELREQAGCSEKREASSVAKSLINTVAGLVGLVAVIVIIMGGITFITSTGDPAKIKKAKDTILYGVIGLIVTMLTWVIVSFITSNVPMS